MICVQTGRGDLAGGKGKSGGSRKSGGGGGAVDENTTLNAGTIQNAQDAERISAENMVDVVIEVQAAGYGDFDSALYRMDWSPTYTKPTVTMLNDRAGSGFMITLDDVNRIQNEAYKKTPTSLHSKIKQLENVGKYKLATMWNSAPTQVRQQFLNGLSTPERKWMEERMVKIGLIR